MKLQEYPFASQRMPIFAARGAVATSQPLAAQAGLRMLQQGGNAVDAALACAIALTVVEPTSNGIGSDAFALVWDGARVHGLNGSGRAPGALSARALRAAGHREMPELGWPSVTVPGAPAAWADLHERFGRIDFEQLFEPAIEYAQRGFIVTPVIAGQWHEAAHVYLPSADPALAGWAAAFAPEGKVPLAGALCRLPGHASTLRRLAEEGARDFYSGAIARRVVEYSEATGGWLGAPDLAAHRSEWVEPLAIAYRGHEVWEIPPNGQGIAALQALKILEGTAVAEYPPGSEAAWHLQIEAMKLAFADAYRHVADPARVEVPVEGLLDPGYLAGRRGLITETAGRPGHGNPHRGGTVYLCTADEDGMMVSFIQSNFAGFGSGIVVPDTGVALQNRGACFVLEEGHPNELAGGKRPRHTIIPGFLTRGGEALGPFGVMGGEMQPQGHVQVVSAMVDHQFNPQAALDAPRWRIEAPGRVLLESGVSGEVAAALAARGHEVEVVDERTGFGRGQIIARLPGGGYVAGSEPRSDGAAVGW